MVEPRGGGSERQSQSGSLERSLTLTSAAAEALIAETIRAEEEDLKEVYDDLAYRELAKDEVVDRKMKVSSAPSGRLDALKRQHSMQFDKTMDLNRAQKLWMLLDDPSFSSASFYYANFSMLIILISTISFCLESEFNCMNVDLHPHLLNYTLPNGQLACDEWEKTWWWFECLAVVFFTAELTLRFTACPSKGKFMKDFANWIDLLAILPFYLEQVAGDVLSAFSVFRVIRLVRVFRVFKMGKSFAGLQLMVSALRASRQVFGILGFLVGIAMIVFSSGVFYLEAPTTKDCIEECNLDEECTLAVAFCAYRSIPASFWWAIVTMTTVGYGDGYPMTAEGRTLAVFAMIAGILIIAMPITVIGDNFSKAYDSQSFEEELIARCTRQVSAREAKPGMEEGTDMIQLEVLMQLLRELELRGNLKVQRPKDIQALTKMLAEYDAGGDGVLRMQEREWRVFLHDVVIDPSDFTNATVSKLARDVHNAQVESARLHTKLDDMRSDLRLVIDAYKKKKTG